MKTDSSKDLTPKEERFCYEYVRLLNATQAAINAQYSSVSARQTGHRLLTKDYIQRRIGALRGNLAETAGISALRVIQEHAKIAFADAGQLRNGWMSLKSFESLTDEQKACIQEVTSREKKGEGGETWVKVRMYDKQKSLDSISAMLGFNAPVKQELTGAGGSALISEFIIEVIDSREQVDAKTADDKGIQ
jgi:phage terminase small subunit